jgi:hypothetical protein
METEIAPLEKEIKKYEDIITDCKMKISNLKLQSIPIQEKHGRNLLNETMAETEELERLNLTMEKKLRDKFEKEIEKYG